MLPPPGCDRPKWTWMPGYCCTALTPSDSPKWTLSASHPQQWINRRRDLPMGVHRTANIRCRLAQPRRYGVVRHHVAHSRNQFE
jgi:hypothetical protein